MPKPDDAERFSLFDWVRAEPQPSKFVPGKFAVTPRLICPGCGAPGPMPALDTEVVCDCGLWLRVEAGASLYVWREVPAEAVLP
jgi:hypothetical protein